MKVYQFCGIVEGLKGKESGYCDGVIGSSMDLSIAENYEKLKEDIWEGLKKNSIGLFKITPESRLFLISLSVIGEK